MSYGQHALDSPLYEDKAIGQHFENDGTPPHGSLKDGVPTTEQIHRMDPQERAIALRAAQKVDPGPDMLDKRNIMFALIALVVCMCSGDNGQYRIQIYHTISAESGTRFRRYCNVIDQLHHSISDLFRDHVCAGFKDWYCLRALSKLSASQCILTIWM